jgi:hypothetical protein
VPQNRFGFDIPVRLPAGQLSGGNWLRPPADMEAALDPVHRGGSKATHPPAKSK